jgi:hypothetical protein
MQRSFTSKIFEWLTSSCQHIATLIDPASFDVIPTLQTNVHIPGTDAYRSWLHTQVAVIDKRLKEVFANSLSIAFTIDYWEKFGRSFLVITAHYMLKADDGMYKLSRHFLCLAPCTDQAHTMS